MGGGSKYFGALRRVSHYGYMEGGGGGGGEERKKEKIEIIIRRKFLSVAEACMATVQT